MDSHISADDQTDAQHTDQQSVDGEIVADTDEAIDAEMPTFIEQFAITVGRTRVHDTDSDTYRWLWKAVIDPHDADDTDETEATDETVECVSGTIFDAVMGVIEDATDGKL